MKTIRHKLTLGMLLAIGLIFTFCQHENDEIKPIIDDDPIPVAIERGQEKLSCTNCTPLQSNGASADFNANAVPSNQWYFDKSHSNVQWETPYKAIGAMLTGRFNYFVLTDLSFDETDPSKISFDAYVRLNSVNTGEPGRDGACLLTTYKIADDAATAKEKANEPENLARLKSTTVAYSTTDAGYIVKANLTFLGVTKEVIGKMYYIKQQDDGPNKLCGITLEFPFLSKTDFGLVSTNVADNVTVKVNATMRKKA